MYSSINPLFFRPYHCRDCERRIYVLDWELVSRAHNHWLQFNRWIVSAQARAKAFLSFRPKMGRMALCGSGRSKISSAATRGSVSTPCPAIRMILGRCLPPNICTISQALGNAGFTTSNQSAPQRYWLEHRLLITQRGQGVTSSFCECVSKPRKNTQVIIYQ